MKKTIKQFKQEVIEDIKKLKNTGKRTKKELIERFNNFNKKDFMCFGKDGNSYLSPKQYFNNLSKKKAKMEYKSIMTSLTFHTIGGELGVNLLNCCGRCRNLFLEEIFKVKCLKEILNI